jgi:hypothetical protein
MATRTRAPRCHQRGDRGGGDQDQRLTATVTATAAANRCHQRPLTAHNSRAICANWGYVRPEKQTVEDQRQGAVTVANTVAKALDKALPYLALAPLATPSGEDYTIGDRVRFPCVCWRLAGSMPAR